MTVKKVVALAMALAMLVSGVALADYAEWFNETGYPICNEIITLTAAGHKRSTPDWNATMMTKELEERLGIHIDGKGYEKTEWPTQFTLMLATDDLPDIIGAGMKGNIDIGTMVKYGEEDYFLDFAQYDELMPNRVAFFAEHPEYANYLTTPEGAVYGFSIYNDQGAISRSHRPYSWNTSWLDKLNLEVPTTLDGFYETLVAFRDQDPNGNGEKDEIPMVLEMSGDNRPIERRLMWGFGLKSLNLYYALYADDNGQLVFGNMTDDYKDYMTYMHRLYAEGLVDPDCATVTGDEQGVRLHDDRYGLWVGGIDNGMRAELDKVQENPTQWVPSTSALKKNADDPTFTVLENAVKDKINVLASATTEYPEVVARFIDYFFDNGEGTFAALNGWEGVNFDYIDAYGIKLADFTKYQGEQDNWSYRSQTAVIYEAFCVIYTGKGDSWEVFDVMTDDDIPELLIPSEDSIVYAYGSFNTWRAAAMKIEDPECYDALPPLPYTTEEATRRSILYTDITNYTTTMYSSFLLGDVDLETGWDAYIDQLKAMGAEELMAIEQAAYNRMMGA